MHATGWSNGQPLPTGAGYGVRVSAHDRDQYFEYGWDHVIVGLDGDTARVQLSKSFWRSCPELRSAAIGRWLKRNDMAPWPPGAPPDLLLQPIGHNRFDLRKP